MKSRVAITLAILTHRCILVSRVLAYKISVQQPQFQDGAGLHLYR